MKNLGRKQEVYMIKQTILRCGLAECFSLGPSKWPEEVFVPVCIDILREGRVKPLNLVMPNVGRRLIINMKLPYSYFSGSRENE